MFRNNIRNSFIITAWEWLEVDQKDPKLNGFLYHLPLASSSPHEEAPWHRYSSTAAWSWLEQYLCNSPTGSQWHWLRSPWISSDRCPWIPGTGQKQETLIRWTISVWLTGNLFTYRLTVSIGEISSLCKVRPDAERLRSLNTGWNCLLGNRGTLT